VTAETLLSALAPLCGAEQWHESLDHQYRFIGLASVLAGLLLLLIA
jgi:hypothetical protein